MSDLTSLAMVTAVVTTGATEAALIKKGSGPTMRPVIGGFLLGLFLFAAGMINPRIATLFCYLIIIGALLINGASLFALAK